MHRQAGSTAPTRSWIRFGCYALAAYTALAALAGASSAHDHAPPLTALRYSGAKAHDGYLHQYCWVTQVDNGTALTECTDSIWDFPAAKRVATGRRVVIRIRKPARPTSFSVQAWPRRGDEISGPEGAYQDLTFKLRPRYVDGEIVAWNANFVVNQSGRHYFIRAGGTWTDEQGSAQNQDAFWLFHVRT